MGASAGVMVTERVEFNEGAAYTGWPKHSVAASIERWLDMPSEDGDVLRDVHAPQWLLIFRDLTVMNANGDFLELSTDEMARFRSVNWPNKARSQPPLLILALLSDCLVDDRIEMAFRVLTASRDAKSMPVNGVAESVELLIEALTVMRFFLKQPDAASKATISESLTTKAEENVVSFEAFVDWGRVEAARGTLLAAKRRSENVNHAPNLRKASINSAQSKEAHHRARERYGAGVTSEKRNKLGMALSKAEMRHDAATVRDLRRKRERLESRVKAVASNEVMTRLLVEVPQLCYADVYELRVEFGGAASGTDAKGSYVTADRLEKMLIARFPSLERGRVLRDVTRVFDLDGNGKIHFDEFVRALSKLIGSFEERVDFVMQLVGGDDELIELWELADLVADAADDMREVGDYCKKAIPKLADKESHLVKRDDFFALLIAEPSLYVQFFWLWLPHVHRDLAIALDSWGKALTSKPDLEFAMDVLLPKFKQAGALAALGENSVTAEQVSAVLRDLITPTEARDEVIAPLVQSLFAHFRLPAQHSLEIDDEKDETIHAPAVWALLACFCASLKDSEPSSTEAPVVNLASLSVQVKAKIITWAFFFSASGDDNSTAPVSDLLGAVEQTLKKNDLWESSIGAAFDAMDTNKDGQVNKDELLAFAKLNPDIIQVLLGM